MIITGPGKTCVIKDALLERGEQDKQWGGPGHDDRHNELDWLDYIAKQSERIDEALSSAEGAEHDPEVRQRFIKIIALAMAACESIDRKAGHG